MTYKYPILFLTLLFYSLQPSAETIPGNNAHEDSGKIRALLSPVVESTISSQVAAQIKIISYKDGDRFKKGSLLIAFDCDVQKAQLQKSRAELQAAEKTHQANMRLQEFNSISKLEVDVSAANVARAKAEVNVKNAHLKKCSIHAPFSGRIDKVKVKPYQSVSQGQELIEILDDSKLKIDLYVPSNWLSWIKIDTPFTINIDETSKQYIAKVIALGSRVDPVSHTIEISAIIEGQHQELLAGMSGVAIFELPK